MSAHLQEQGFRLLQFRLDVCAKRVASRHVAPECVVALAANFRPSHVSDPKHLREGHVHQRASLVIQYIEGVPVWVASVPKFFETHVQRSAGGFQIGLFERRKVDPNVVPSDDTIRGEIKKEQGHHESSLALGFWDKSAILRAFLLIRKNAANLCT
jgi:hypothetical protein